MSYPTEPHDPLDQPYAPLDVGTPALNECLSGLADRIAQLEAASVSHTFQVGSIRDSLVSLRLSESLVSLDDRVAQLETTSVQEAMPELCSALRDLASAIRLERSQEKEPGGCPSFLQLEDIFYKCTGSPNHPDHHSSGVLTWLSSR